MTATYGRKRGINWIRLVGWRECATRGCFQTMRRISFFEQRAKSEWTTADGQRNPPEPMFRRCHLCAAKAHHREVIDRWERDNHFLPRAEYLGLPRSVRHKLGVRGFAERYPTYDGPSDREWRLDGAVAGPRPCAI